MENSRSIIPRVVTIIYGLFYFLVMRFSEYSDVTEPDKLPIIELYTVPIAVQIFTIGCVLMFYNELHAGIVLLIWHFLIWMFVLAFWDVGGINIILAFPVVFLALWLIHNWYFKNNPDKAYKAYKYRFLLRLMMINYSAVYFLVIFFHVVPALFDWNLITHIDENTYWNYSSFLGIALIFTTLMYIAALGMLWKSELISGIILVLWYASILYLSFGFEELMYSGPWFLFAFPLFVHGILLIIYHYKIGRKSVL